MENATGEIIWHTWDERDDGKLGGHRTEAQSAKWFSRCLTMNRSLVFIYIGFVCKSSKCGNHDLISWFSAGNALVQVNGFASNATIVYTFQGRAILCFIFHLAWKTAHEEILIQCRIVLLVAICGINEMKLYGYYIFCTSFDSPEIWVAARQLNRNASATHTKSISLYNLMDKTKKFPVSSGSWKNIILVTKCCNWFIIFLLLLKLFYYLL